jgi:predicted dehydrogenase/NADPH:quinone reductase-like Zn-dependent oxidoreductase
MRPLQSLAASAQQAVSARLYRSGYTPKSLEETQRDVLWWVYARVQAGLNLRPALLSGWGIAWTSAGYAELVPIEVPKAGRDRVTVRVLFSSVSPGTERAQYLRLPNAQVGVLGRPGYSAAGTVLSVGGGTSGLTRGDLVAVTGAAHASVVNVPVSQVFKVDPTVGPEYAALVMLGTICLNGADLAAVQPGERVAVVGSGPIGILSFRMACRGGVPVAVIATSRRGEVAARSSGAPLLTVGEDGEEIARLGADVVIEATGDPRGINTAIAAAGQGGRIILLGSARGITPSLALDELRRKRLRLIGAHVDTLDLRPGPSGRSARREAGERFLELLKEGELAVADLLGPAVDPRRAAAFYRDLAQNVHTGGAYFDWGQLPSPDAVRRGHLLRPPNVLGLGMDSTRPLRPRGQRGPRSLTPSDPFAGATGNLRLGLIGCGDIAVHNATGAAAAPNVEVVACFDPNRRLAEDLASRHGATAMRSQEEILAAPEIDAVILSVPHDLHAPLAIEACRAGKNVIVEKPLARDLDGAIAMAGAAAENRVWLSPCFPQRYEPKIQVARRLLDEGALGDVQGTLIQLLLDKSPSYWRGGFSGRAQSDWRRLKERAGGGVLIMNLSHHLDLMRYLSGLEVETVLALAEPSEGIEDMLAASLRYTGGALGTLLGSSSTRGSIEEAMSLWGTEGRLVLEPRARVYTLRPTAGLRTTRWYSFGRLPSVNIRAVYLSRLATAVSQGRGPEITAADGVAVQAIIEAVYRSAPEQTAVRPAELTGELRQTEPAIA